MSTARTNPFIAVALQCLPLLHPAVLYYAVLFPPSYHPFGGFSPHPLAPLWLMLPVAALGVFSWGAGYASLGRWCRFAVAWPLCVGFMLAATSTSLFNVVLRVVPVDHLALKGTVLLVALMGYDAWRLATVARSEALPPAPERSAERSGILR
ncbi:MAG: hypothetical protein IT340_21060 [Chloroflexi bacterium]|nr:hypothetical protein [Chloroflexota bacterium]